MSLHSIRFRLTAWFAGIFAAIFACAGLGMWLTLRHSIKATVDKELRERFATVRGYVEQEARWEGLPHLQEELNEDSARNAGSAFLLIVDRKGALIYRSPTTDHWPLTLPPANTLPPSGLSGNIHLSGRLVRFLTMPVSIGVVQIGLGMDEFQQLQREFLWSFLFGTPLLLLLSAAAGYWMSGHALQPVDRIAVAAQRITSASLSERLPRSGAKDELDRLSEVLNDMLARLESSFARITQFTTDASHELRTPLAIIRSTAELIRSRPRTAGEQDSAWASVLVQTERTTQLVDDLLTLARADATPNSPLFHCTDVAQVASQTVSEVQVLAASKGVRVACQSTPRLPVRGDEEALRRLFLILLDNALKATPAGGTVDVSFAVNTAAHTVQISVIDTGSGIAPEDLPHIFERFYRAAKDRSRETGGTGLGLAIAQSIAGRHGGSLHAESEWGRGAAFRFTLPLLIGMEARLSEVPESVAAGKV